MTQSRGGDFVNAIEKRHDTQEFGDRAKFWQPKYDAFTIENENKSEEKLTCLHLNPVRAGLTAHAVAWV